MKRVHVVREHSGSRAHPVTHVHRKDTLNPAKPEVFGAISHPARRRMLDLLADGDCPVNTIAASFEMSRPAVSQHLRVLLDAGLVTEARHGRERRYRLAPEQLGPVRDWLSRYEKFWDDNFRRLKRHLDQQDTP